MDLNDFNVIWGGGVVLGLVLWVACAYLCYRNAPRFGRGSGTWGILGILFGPFALMALYVLPRAGRSH
jgi:hypothetical protein